MQLAKKLPLLGTSIVCAYLLACSSHDETRAPEKNRPEGAEGLLPPSERPEVPPQVPDAWVGHTIGASPGVWRYAGRFPLSRPGAKHVEPRIDPSLPSVPNDTPNVFAVGNPDGTVYTVELDESEQQEIADVLTAAGYAEPRFGEVDVDVFDEDSASVLKGWSLAVDNRADLGAAAKGQFTWPFVTIGQLKHDGAGSTTTGYCTATFVTSGGDANTGYIITAAHCLWDFDGNYDNPDFWPRQDRCQTNTGAGVPGCSQGPFGAWDSGQWRTSSYFTDHCIGKGPTTTHTCAANDILMLRVHRQTGASDPGALGLTYRSESYLDGVNKYHRGYPDCGSPGAPTPASPKICLPRTLYGDGAHGIGSGDMVDSTGWPRLYPTSTDSSPGQSGGPFYHTSGGNHFVHGVLSGSSCDGAACGPFAFMPSYMCAMTRTYYNWFIDFAGL